jgi:hypothetical protein
MQFSKTSLLSIVVLLSLGFTALQGCKKETEDFNAPKYTEYYPLQVGKYITYRLDSTVYINLNTQKVVRTYTVRDVVDAEITDNLGRKAYRIRRLMQNPGNPDQWVDNAVFVVTPQDKSVELVDNNQRTIKLKEPLKEGSTWRGNSFISDTDESFFAFLASWEFIYEGVDLPYTLGTREFEETVSVLQSDDTLGDPDDKRFYYQVEKSSEVYAKGIGLIYKDFLFEAWQPADINNPGFYNPNSFGVRLTYLNHN